MGSRKKDRNRNTEQRQLLYSGKSFYPDVKTGGTQPSLESSVTDEQLLSWYLRRNKYILYAIDKSQVFETRDLWNKVY